MPQVRHLHRRSGRGVYRFAPRGPRWPNFHSRLPVEATPRLLHRSGQALRAGASDGRPSRTGRQSPGMRQACRDRRGLDRRAMAPHLRCHLIPRPPLPAPHLKMLYRHPSVWGGIIVYIILIGIKVKRAVRQNPERPPISRISPAPAPPCRRRRAPSPPGGRRRACPSTALRRGDRASSGPRRRPDRAPVRGSAAFR